NSTRKDLEIAVARVGENLIALEDLYKQAGSTDASVLDWARAEAQRDPKEHDTSISVIQNVSKLQQSLDSRLSDLESATTRLAAQRKILDTAEQELASAIEHASSSSEELTRLFQAAHQYFQIHSSSEECPLCESREFARTLPSAVEKRLQGWSAVQTALNKKSDAQRSFEASSSQSVTATRYAFEAARSLVRILVTDWP